MPTTLNEVVVHVDESLDEATIEDLEQSIRLDRGVVSVGHRARQHHLLMVVYDSEQAKAINILHAFQERKLHAQLLGM